MYPNKHLSLLTTIWILCVALMWAGSPVSTFASAGKTGGHSKKGKDSPMHKNEKTAQKRSEASVVEPPGCADNWLRSPMEYESVIRYFHKTADIHASGVESVLVTQCTVDRLERLERQARAWTGSVSVAVYITTDTLSAQKNAMETLDKFALAFRNDATIHSSLTISILFGLENTPSKWNCTLYGSAGTPLYPVNALRNLAVAAINTTTTSAGRGTGPLLFLVDVDFIPSEGLAQLLHQTVTMNEKSDIAKIVNRGGVLVIPAFEAQNATTFPAAGALTHDFIKKGIADNSVLPFHLRQFFKAHGPSNYTRWTELLDKEEAVAYPIEYGDRYEPYIIMSRDWFVPYDERFRGYGLNKVVQLRWLADCGAQYHVLSRHFVTALAHAKSATFQATYGAHFRTSVNNVLATYKQAMSDQAAGGVPALSRSTAAMFAANGLQNALKYCANRVVKL